MSTIIGVICGHGEVVAPDNPRYSSFFSMLIDQYLQIEPVRDTLSTTSLSEYDALLIGGSRKRLPVAEVEALRKWVNAGGNLLILSSRDPANPNWRGIQRHPEKPIVPTHADPSPSTPRLIPGLTFHRRRGRDIAPIDHSSLTGWPGQLIYHSSCTLSLETPDSRLTHALAPQNTWQSRRTARLDIGLVAGSTSPTTELDDLVFIRFRQGCGLVIVLGSENAINDSNLIHQGGRIWGNRDFLSWLFLMWTPGLLEHELKARKQMPQRHRLLHGYPMRSLMWDLAQVSQRLDTENFLELRGPEIKRGDRERRVGCTGEPGEKFSPKDNRSLLIGVLPHPFCNPAVKGCGFCTFPHEYYSAQRGSAVTEKVVQEIDGFLLQSPEWRDSPVKAVYLGGGTANLTAAEPFAKLCRRLADVFDLSRAEVTLEGAPAYFVDRHPLLIDIMQATTGARHYRISMGLQTFDINQLKRMGRLGFGGPEKFAEVVRAGHSRGFTVSADLLINLPGQQLQQIQHDVQRAIDLGLDHICLYHLVLFEGLGTEWSNDSAMLASLPPNEEAEEHWMIVRDLLLTNGYSQTTLTNFERADCRGSDSCFLYETSAFQPEVHDMLGFGPAAYSLITDNKVRRSENELPPWAIEDHYAADWLLSENQDRRSSKTGGYYAVKTVNPDSANDYCAAVDAGDRPWQSIFLFDEYDMKLLYLTRKIATLSINRGGYRDYFDSDCLDDFPLEFEALAADRLIAVTADAVRLTPRGMFYADTVAGLLAWRHVKSIRRNRRLAETAKQEGRHGRAHLLEFGQHANLFQYMG